MKRTLWNENWKFWPDGDAFALVWNVPDIARDITLPHDAMIEQAACADSPNKGNTGYRNGGNYTYVKTLTLTPEDLARKFLLRFDGVYCHAMVYVNEQFAGCEANGYSEFYIDITHLLREGDNEIRVQVRNSGMTNSRWYSGSGIYRDVYLLTSEKVYFEPGYEKFSTESISDNCATVLAETSVINETSQAGLFTLATEIRSKDGSSQGHDEVTVYLRANERRTFRRKILVKSPVLWSAETPDLYSFQCTLKKNDSLIDTAEGSFGIRMLSLDPLNGLCINGTSVKLRGACIHHDSGLIGAATYKDAELRRIRLLKEAGFNAIRMSHHTSASILLEVCDEVGMYVMDEFSDMWTRAKNDLDYALDFNTWWQTDIDLMVRKNYNHPSVIMYSVGNEIPEIGTDFGSELCAKIADRIRESDSTRYITACINGVFAAGDDIPRILSDITAADDNGGNSGGNVNDFMTVMDTKMNEIVVHEAISARLDKACAGLDIAGYNYMAARYEPDSLKYPNRVMVGSETYPPDIARNWELVKKLPSVIGDFTWTGWDYIGEAGVGIPAYHFGEGGFGAQYPCQLAYCGDFDLTGFRRPMSYYREIVFGLRQKPYITVLDPHHYGEPLIKTPWVMSDAHATWDWKGCEGKPVIVEVYASGDEVELSINGTSLGRKKTEKFVASFETVYEPGIIRAEAFKNGESLGIQELQSPSEASQISVTADYTGNRLVYLSLELQDENGRTVTCRDEMISLEAKNVSVLGFGSADPKPLYNYSDKTVSTFEGRAQIILEKPETPGSVEITSESGLHVQYSIL